jgi:threonine/homoserine/homoserine lactone efflux protein
MIKVLLLALAVVVGVLNALYLESIWVEIISKAIGAYLFFSFYWSWRRDSERMPRSPDLFSRRKKPPPDNPADDAWGEADSG